MNEPLTANGLQLHWTPVVDERGRTHMEAHWTGSRPAAHASVPAGVTHAA